MQLNELSSLFAFSRIVGDGSATLTGLQMDSRKVKPGDLFVCISGFEGFVKDGHLFAQSAADAGAAALVTERELAIEIPQLIVKDTKLAAAMIANHYYQHPSREMKVIAITGTNGKTTTSYIIERILSDHGFKTGLMGNIGMKIGADFYETVNNTQDAVDLQYNFRRMCEVRTDYCIMEATSQGLARGRVKGCRFRTALFTNLTQDHLDEHQTMDNYKAAKGLLFARLGNDYSGNLQDQQFVVLNADEPVSKEYALLTAVQVITYGISQEADVKASNIKVTAAGTQFKLICPQGNVHIHLKLIGKFNVYNTLGAIAVTLLEGVPLAQIKHSLEGMQMVEGRMEPVNEGQPFLVLVDYAHTPDGMENALSTVSELAEAKLITVFGCGGDRDKGKRPKMGKIAAHYSDYIFVTSDNPRTENPDMILLDIERGLADDGYAQDQYEMIVDRRTAIKRAIEMAGPNDVVLIAGKGHETYQLMNGERHHFDDREEARAAIRGLGNDQAHM